MQSIQKSACGVGRFAASSFNKNKNSRVCGVVKKVLVLLTLFFSFDCLTFQLIIARVASCDVVLDLGHQRRNGDERAPQRFGRQNAFQFLHLRGVNARVLRWKHLFTRSFSLHPHRFGRAASHFPVERLHEPQLVLALVLALALVFVFVVDLVCDSVTQLAQCVECERRLHNEGDRNVNCGGSWIRTMPLGVTGRAVRGLCFRV